MIVLKTKEEIEIMREAAQIVSRTLGLLATYIKPGVTPIQLDEIAEEYIRSQKALPGFKGLYGCPSTLLTSVNEQVVHGLPTNKPLEDGDIVSVDCGAKFEGFYGDHAFTFEVGEVNPKTKKLLQVTRECLDKAIEACVVGNKIGDIGFAVQVHAERNGYGVVRDLVGHGLGRKMHEEPQVPNYGKPGKGAKIENGMVIAIEPMINMGTHRVKQLKDGWTIVTQDGLPSAHFEHDVAIVDGKADVLSTFAFVDEAINKQKNG